VSIYRGQAVPPNTNQSEDFEFQYRISLPFSIPTRENVELVTSLQFSPDDEKIRVILRGGYQLLLSKNQAGDYAAGSNNFDWHNPMLLAGQNESGFQSMVAGYRMTEVSLRKPYTWRSNCGNGVVDEGELFDNGQPWEYQEYGASCGATCGDGQRDQGEQCDDGNDSNDDECATTCRNHRCGDGVVRADLQPGDFGFETCDDGNLNNDDACSSVCQAHRCGDGVVREDLQEGEEGFEACDDGNQSNTDSCSISCRSAVCGDGLVNRTALINDPAFENCDDGNNIDGDGCTNCLLDNCGNGQVDVGEECDDGNNNHSDDCARCQSLGICTRIGRKRGYADWSCSAGQRLPRLGEWWRVARCITEADHTFMDRGISEQNGRYHGVGVSVGGCGCKWNQSWCDWPSVETIREGRMCGDYEQLHICVSD
jgi:cysteine-rich repeat protein